MLNKYVGFMEYEMSDVKNSFSNLKLTNEQLVERQLAAYNARDIDAFCSCFHPTVTVINLVSNKKSCEGIQQFREIYQKLFSSTPKLHCELVSRIVLDEAIIDEEIVTGLPNYSDGLHAVAIYSFADCLINRVWFPK